MVVIRQAQAKDGEVLYAIGCATPEFRVNPSQPFMTGDEFAKCLKDPNSVVLLAETDGAVQGFVYANTKDVEIGARDGVACLVYLVVVPECRGQGVAVALCEEVRARLRAMGIQSVYAWAHAGHHSPVEALLQRLGFAAGGLYRWYDCAIGEGK